MSRFDETLEEAWTRETWRQTWTAATIATTSATAIAATATASPSLASANIAGRSPRNGRGAIPPGRRGGGSEGGAAESRQLLSFSDFGGEGGVLFAVGLRDRRAEC